MDIKPYQGVKHRFSSDKQPSRASRLRGIERMRARYQIRDDIYKSLAKKIMIQAGVPIAKFAPDSELTRQMVADYLTDHLIRIVESGEDKKIIFELLKFIAAPEDSALNITSNAPVQINIAPDFTG